MDGIPCPQCPTGILEPRNYEAIVVLSRSKALFTMRCPLCGARVSAMRDIPPEMKDVIRDAALQAGAGMGCER